MVLAVYWKTVKKSSSKTPAFPLENLHLQKRNTSQSALEVQVLRNGLMAHCSKERYLSWLFINNLQNHATNNDGQASD